MRILVLGASGFVGAVLMRRLRRAGTEAVGTYRSNAAALHADRALRLDLADTPAMLRLIDEIAPDAVVTLAAESDVRKAEERDARAEAEAMVASIHELADSCKRAGRPLCLLSSDYVFDGSGGPYAEDDAPSPSGAYGRHKLAAERAALGGGGPALVVRTSMVYGWPGPGQHPNFAARVVTELRGGGAIEAHHDVVRTPVYVEHLADDLAELVLSGATGVYHSASRDAVSMFDFARTTCDVFGLDEERVSPSAAAETDPSRPLRSGLKTDRIATRLRRRPPSTEEGLTRMKEEEPNDA